MSPATGEEKSTSGEVSQREAPVLTGSGVDQPAQGPVNTLAHSNQLGHLIPAVDLRYLGGVNLVQQRFKLFHAPLESRDSR